MKTLLVFVAMLFILGCKTDKKEEPKQPWTKYNLGWERVTCEKCSGIGIYGVTTPFTFENGQFKAPKKSNK